MTPHTRILTIAVLPILTLFLGWQLGVRYEQKELEDMAQYLEELYSGGESGSGQMVVNPEKEVNIALLWGVWRILLNHYIEPDKLQVQSMVYGATAGLVEALDDPYTVFMTPTDSTEFTESLQGRLQGIGAELTEREGLIVVVAPIKGSPAAEAGVLPEDIIVAVNGESMEGKTLSDAVTLIRGDEGTTVNISMLRDGELVDFSIVRADIRVPSVEYEVQETASGSVGYIALNQFGDSALREVQNALDEFQNEELDGIVFDVRYNGGGYLEGAVELASLFLREGTVVTVQHRQGDPEVHVANGHPVYPDIPLAVLINEGSASASEILAGALQDHGRATIIGKKSFGKGTVQEIFDLPGGASVRVTTAKWLTPDGRDLGKEGVLPDIEVDRTREDIEAERDPQLDAALEWLLDGETAVGTSSSSSSEAAE